MAAPPEVVVVPTGTANLASVLAGLRRVGAAPRLLESAGEAARVPRLVLPGVGTLEAAMARLEAEGLIEPLRARLAAGLPTLAVCLGLQILCEGSDESPEAPGLGVVPGRVTRFEGAVRIPQLGWNLVEPAEGCQLLEAGHAYYANSYRLEVAPPGWASATTDYGGPFVAAIERGAQLACQFHPELSGRWGLALIRRWLEASGGAPC